MKCYYSKSLSMLRRPRNASRFHIRKSIFRHLWNNPTLFSLSPVKTRKPIRKIIKKLRFAASSANAFLSLRQFSEVQCDHPESTKDGFIEVSNFKGSYVYGSRATYHCNPGFILWGKFNELGPCFYCYDRFMTRSQWSTVLRTWAACLQLALLMRRNKRKVSFSSLALAICSLFVPTPDMRKRRVTVSCP